VLPVIRYRQRRPAEHRFFNNRQVWKQAIYSLAFLSYLCSFLFFGIGAAAVLHQESMDRAALDMLVAIYFLLQVIFLFVLSWFVERRRHTVPIHFPDRRSN
jgi:cyanate permease